MAFQKNIALPTGVAGDYFRIAAFRWDRAAREASALFALYKDAATAAAGQPLQPMAAKLRLTGAQFDTYLGPGALAAAADDVLAQLYAAAREISEARHETGEPVAGAQIVSDHGSDLFWDATDV
ncbi:MAG: hypothetical protein HZC55_04000 [Verrucomicrobia bacterium]|nr:hypothetical protein [Verrucomicrobiota bacterium]